MRRKTSVRPFRALPPQRMRHIDTSSGSSLMRINCRDDRPAPAPCSAESTVESRAEPARVAVSGHNAAEDPLRWGYPEEPASSPRTCRIRSPALWCARAYSQEEVAGSASQTNLARTREVRRRPMKQAHPKSCLANVSAAFQWCRTASRPSPSSWEHSSRPGTPWGRPLPNGSPRRPVARPTRRYRRTRTGPTPLARSALELAHTRSGAMTSSFEKCSR